MRKALKWAAVGFAGLATLLLVAGLLAVLLLDWNRLREPASAYLSQQAGREIEIQGDLRVDLSWRPWIHARDIRLANADWASAADMVEIEELSLRIDLRELLQGRLVVPNLRVAGGRIDLETDAEGRSNWNLDDTPGVPEERSEIPLFESIVVEDTTLLFRDALREITLKATVASAEVASPDQGEFPVSLEGEGEIQQQPFSIALRGGAITALREASEPYPLEADIQVGYTEARLAGTLMDPLDLSAMDMELEISGRSPEELAPILTIPLPSTAPYRLRGRLLHEEDLWRFENFEGTVGDSDLAGSLAVDTAGERPLITADLVSRTLDFDDLGTLIGLPPDPEQLVAGAEEGVQVRLLPDAPLQLEQVRETDAEVTFRGESVIAPGLPLQDVELVLDLKDGVLRLTPLWFGLGGGRLTVFTSIYSTVDPVQTDYDFRLENVQLQNVFDDAGIEGAAEGVLEGRARFTTLGNSVRSAMATAEGDLAIVMEGGQVTGSLLQLLDVGFLEALAVVLSDGEPGDMEVRCLVASFDLQDGIMTPSPLLVDTDHSVITGEGSIDLGEETIDLRIAGEAKDPSLAGSRVPVVIGGTFDSPSFGVDPTELAVRGGLAVGLGALLAPLAAVLPFLDLGAADDSPCAQLIQEAEGEVDP